MIHKYVSLVYWTQFSRITQIILGNQTSYAEVRKIDSTSSVGANAILCFRLTHCFRTTSRGQAFNIGRSGHFEQHRPTTFMLDFNTNRLRFVHQRTSVRLQCLFVLALGMIFITSFDRLQHGFGKSLERRFVPSNVDTIHLFPIDCFQIFNRNA